MSDAVNNSSCNASTAKPARKKCTENVAPTDVVLPNAQLIEWMHELRLPDRLSTPEQKETAKRCLMEAVEADEMLPFYRSLCQDFQWPVDAALVERLSEANATEAKALDLALTDAEENLGDVEIKDCLLSKAHFLCRIGDIDGCVEAYERAREKTVGSGGRLDVLLTLIRIGILYEKKELTRKTLAEAKIDCEKGGDWERRNKLKIYSAIVLAQNRKFVEAAELLLGCTAIFTASELVSFKTFIFITVVLSLVSLDRPALKTQVMNSPETCQVLEEDFLLKTFLDSYVGCQYATFMNSLVGISKRVERDVYLHKHARYFVRAARMNAYRQFLQPFSSVTLASMASTFGVSETFIEADVADYIANAKLHCKIDRVRRVILYKGTTSTDPWHIKTIKQGDLLLGKIQKLSKIIDM